jgi:hypothetical protein
MRIRNWTALAAGGLCLALLLAVLAGGVRGAWADEQVGGFAISWWSVDGGGGSSQGGPYTLRGTVGQPDAGRLSGGEYRLESGFWAVRLVRYIYLPVVGN